MKKTIAIASGKLAGRASRIVGKGGSNIPGVVARKIDHQLLKKLASQVDHVVLVSGVNGKTTTANLLASILHTKETIIHNKEGANLITGITACFLGHSTAGGRIKEKYAVIEVDELTIPKLVKEITPSCIVMTNIFRDQLDRSGEIDILLNKIEEAIKPLNTKLILNGDDPFLYRLSKLKKKTVYYGLDRAAFSFEQQTMSESKFCPTCGKEMKYDHIHYGQLGYFRCSCGFKRPKVKYEVNNIQNKGSISFLVNRRRFDMAIGGTFNVYNALAAISVAKELGWDDESIRKGLLSYRSENGRMQAFQGEKHAHMLNLVKNPAGVNSSISEVLYAEGDKQVVLFLNDMDLDGRDISWIWDADFERLDRKDLTSFICSGTRAYDLAIRLKYAGVDETLITVIESKEQAIDTALANQKNTFFLPNYTALEPVRKMLEKKLIK